MKTRTLAVIIIVIASCASYYVQGKVSEGIEAIKNSMQVSMIRSSFK